MQVAQNFESTGDRFAAEHVCGGGLTRRLLSRKRRRPTLTPPNRSYRRDGALFD
jgi:hypothetical protein